MGGVVHPQERNAVEFCVILCILYFEEKRGKKKMRNCYLIRAMFPLCARRQGESLGVINQLEPAILYPYPDVHANFY